MEVRVAALAFDIDVTGRPMLLPRGFRPAAPGAGTGCVPARGGTPRSTGTGRSTRTWNRTCRRPTHVRVGAGPAFGPGAARATYMRSCGWPALATGPRNTLQRRWSGPPWPSRAAVDRRPPAGQDRETARPTVSPLARRNDGAGSEPGRSYSDARPGCVTPRVVADPRVPGGVAKRPGTRRRVTRRSGPVRPRWAGPRPRGSPASPRAGGPDASRSAGPAAGRRPRPARVGPGPTPRAGRPARPAC